VLAGSWPGPVRVLFGSLTGGAGRSTAAALLSAAAVDAGAAVLVLDGTGQVASDVAVRLGTGEATRRDWTWAVDPAAGLHFAALHRRTGPGPVPVVAVGGDRGTAAPADALAAAAAAAARSFPVVLVDLPGGAAATRAAVAAGRPELLVMLCRPDPVEIGDTAEFLRDLAPDLDCARRAVIAVRADRRGLPRPARRVLAAAADAAAGVLTVVHLPGVTGRRSTVAGPGAVTAGRTLAAAAALTGGSPDPAPLPLKGDLQR
jgi:hypothetical protein